MEKMKGTKRERKSRKKNRQRQCWANPKRSSQRRTTKMDKKSKK